MHTTIGNKGTFAIEYHVTQPHPHMMGGCRIWIKNAFLGDIEDIHPLGANAYILQYFLNKETKYDNLALLSPKEIFNSMSENDTMNDDCLFNVGEGFDDFQIYAFKSKNNCVFVWNLEDTSPFKYAAYPAGPHKEQVSLNEFKSTLDKFWEKIRN